MQLRCLKQRCSGLLLVKAHVLHLFILTLRYESSWEVSVTFLIGQALLMWTVESGIHLQSTEMVNWISTTQLVRVGPSIPEGYGSIPLMLWWEHGSSSPMTLRQLFLLVVVSSSCISFPRPAAPSCPWVAGPRLPPRCCWRRVLEVPFADVFKAQLGSSHWPLPWSQFRRGAAWTVLMPPFRCACWAQCWGIECWRL